MNILQCNSPFNIEKNQRTVRILEYSTGYLSVPSKSQSEFRLAWRKSAKPAAKAAPKAFCVSGGLLKKHFITAVSRCNRTFAKMELGSEFL